MNTEIFTTEEAQQRGLAVPENAGTEVNVMTDLLQSESKASRLAELKIVLNSENRDNSYENVRDQDHFNHVQFSIEASGTSDLVEIVLPQDDQLQIDYDQPDLPLDFDKALGLLAQAYLNRGDGLDYAITISKSGNRHVLITVPGVKFTAVERVAWQAVFGSDPLREGLSLVSIQRGLKNPSLMVELKNQPKVTTTYYR